MNYFFAEKPNNKVVPRCGLDLSISCLFSQSVVIWARNGNVFNNDTGRQWNFPCIPLFFVLLLATTYVLFTKRF